eukprot:9975585-Ditylum_brightwellii.AAC.1
MSDLSCPPEAKFPAAHQSSPCEFKKSKLTLHNAIPNFPCPARYHGYEILNPIYAIKTERRKHRRVHGKIGFVELAKKIAQNWKDVDKDVKEYFKELSSKDHERYCCDIKRSKDHGVSMTVLTANGMISDDKLSTAYDNHIEFKRDTDITNCSSINKKRKLIHGDPHMEAYLKQQCSNSVTLEPPEFETSVIQSVQAKQPLKCALQEHSTNTCPKVHLSCNTISYICPDWPVTHGNRILESSDCFHDFKTGCMSAQCEDEVDKDILKFLFDLVNE